MFLTRLLKSPDTSYFLFGPRGSGKSMWLRHTFPNAHFVNLLEEASYQRLLADPGLFAAEMRSIERGSWVVVDEIQRLPNLLNEVHRAIEERKIRFVLCGSSARKLKRAGVNLLGGRAARRAMHPFVPEELGKRFDLAKALSQGLLPIVWDSDDPAETVAAYARLYLKEEIQAEALVRNLPGFARFLPIAALYHGQVLNISNTARESGVSRTTVAGYVDILEETLLCFRLPAYEARLRVRERKLPKLYWCDPGIVRSVKRATARLAPEETGALFEGLVAQTIRAYRDYRGVCDDFYYWAPAESASTEVDFLLTGPDGIVAVEAKSGRQFSTAWCKGLRAVSPLRGLRRRLIVCPEGPPLTTEDGIKVVPFAVFASMLADGTLWP